MNELSIPYNQRIINLYALLAIISLGGSVFYCGFNLQVPFDFWLTTVIGLFPLALKLAAPRVSLVQAFICAIMVLVINYLSTVVLSGGPFVVWFFLSKVIEIVCVLGFGFYWVQQEYIPSWANKW